ncbi:MAG TPA: ATP-binding protein [Candidatus Blautia faecigallinarum]|uniref:ATP-binding protein n=1 Tax=Candidatus Blautia faecigallinarum TaxID=2838488 RepID=A0A9D2DUC1_9FIRM|nr:ATP-binding protein [Candidatus Blautia faecigallinarum]
MNMLDNALEAAAKVAFPEERSVSLQIKVSAPYLAIRCENSYNGEVKKDKKGRLLTTKENPAVHGYGCRQMEKMAKKYQSVLLFHTEDPHIFTVETALRIPEKG